MTTASPRGGKRDDLLALAAVVRMSAQASSVFGAQLNGMQSNLQATASLFLSENEGITPSDLARKLGVLPASVSRLLRAFESRGLTRVEHDTRDRRVRRIRLTPQGSASVAAGLAALADLSHAPATSSIVTLLRVPVPDAPPPSLLDAITAMASSGARANSAMSEALGGEGPRSGLDRWILILLYAKTVPPHPAQLAEHLCVTRQSMATHLTRLETQGLIRREAPADRVDGRLVEVVLTASGLRAAQAIFGAFRRHRNDIGDAVAAFVAAGSRHSG